MENILQTLGVIALLYIPIGLIFPKLVPQAKGRLQTLRVTLPILVIIAAISSGISMPERLEERQKEEVAQAQREIIAQEAKTKANAEAKAAEERKNAEVKEKLQTEVLDKMDAYILAHVSGFKIDTVSNNWYQLSVYINEGVTNDSARKIAMHTVKAIVDDLVKQGRQPADEKVDVFVTAEHKKLGTTGKELFRVIGMSSYDWQSDQISWKWM